MKKQHFDDISTAAIHGYGNTHPEHAHLTPIYATSTYVFDNAEQGMNRFSGKEPGYIYSRFGNPTTNAAAGLIAQLEGFGIKDIELQAYLHASGQAAMTTLFLSMLSPGDAILSTSNLYGGTLEFMQHILQELGIQILLTDLNNHEAVEALFKKHPIKLVHLETPSNPILQCIDIKAICDMAHRYNAKVSVDNTIATPYLQQPFLYGADFVFHSTTKFLNGHGSAIGGALIGRDVELMRTKIYHRYKLIGGNSNPFDAFLLLQGIKTLGVRMDRHCSNAMEVATFLQNHPAIAKVHYNGLPSHPDHAIASQQMKQYGALLSFELKDGFDKAKKFINSLRLCVLAVSLGTVDTLISHPASMSHAGLSKEQRLASGISDGLIRMSVGIENIQDILNDLDQALNK